MCHCLIRVDVVLTVTQQPPWITWTGKNSTILSCNHTHIHNTAANLTHRQSCAVNSHQNKSMIWANFKIKTSNLDCLESLYLVCVYVHWCVCVCVFSCSSVSFLCVRDHLSWSICRSWPYQDSLKLRRGGFHLQPLMFINSGFHTDIKTWGWHNNNVNHSILFSYIHTHTLSLCFPHRSWDKWKAWPTESCG